MRISNVQALVRHVGAASLAGFIAGVVVAGVLGRLAMRVSGFMSRPDLIGRQTANGNRVGEITLEGTIAIALFAGVTAGITGGVLYAVAEPWLRGRRAKGVIFGVALLLALGFTVIDANNFDFQRFGPVALNVAMFAALFLAFGVVAAWLFDRIRGAIGGTGMVATGFEIVAWLAAVVVVGLSVPVFLQFGGADGFFMISMVALVVPVVVRWRALPEMFAYAAFALPVVVGGARLVSHLRAMLGV